MSMELEMQEELLRAKLNAAQDPNTDVAALTELASDPSWMVRLSVVYNPSTPVEVLKDLVSDENKYVSRVAASNVPV
jgi:hypothetical protein